MEKICHTTEEIHIFCIEINCRALKVLKHYCKPSGKYQSRELLGSQSTTILHGWLQHQLNWASKVSLCRDQFRIIKNLIGSGSSDITKLTWAHIVARETQSLYWPSSAQTRKEEEVGLREDCPSKTRLSYAWKSAWKFDKRSYILDMNIW